MFKIYITILIALPYINLGKKIIYYTFNNIHKSTISSFDNLIILCHK